MKVIVIIQARIGSSRLPGKILKSLGNHDVLTYVTSRCKLIEGVDEVIVATSTLEGDDVVEQWCEQHNVKCYRGSESDVLDRYMQVAQQYTPDYVVRVTADCPFVDINMAAEMIKLAIINKVDIVDLDSSTLPRGLASEVVSYRALKYMHEHGKEERHREHVTYYAYEYRDEFTRVTYDATIALQQPKLRVTLDTPEDYEVIAAVANAFDNIDVSSEQVVQFLMEHPQIANINAEIEQKKVT